MSLWLVCDSEGGARVRYGKPKNAKGTVRPDPLPYIQPGRVWRCLNERNQVCSRARIEKREGPFVLMRPVKEDGSSGSWLLRIHMDSLRVGWEPT